MYKYYEQVNLGIATAHRTNQNVMHHSMELEFQMGAFKNNK